MPIHQEPLRMITDDRGVVFEPLSTDAFVAQKNAHIVISGPQVVRGNHYHLEGTETIAVMGPTLVRFKEKDQIEEVEISKGEAIRFVFRAGVAHAVKNLSDQPNILVAFNTVEHDPEHPNTKKEVLI